MSDRTAVEAFVYREARLMDEFDYDGWFALWDEDGVYHVPVDPDPSAHTGRRVSIIRDDYPRLQQRVDRLKTGSVLAVEGQKGAMRRLVSNIEISTVDTAGEIEVGSNFILGIARTAEQQLWIGRTIHRLRQHVGEFRIARKTVFLINSTHETPLLQFLI
jgi:3-phenylpropionate/cinnamic acid dioxygenase small subunit